MEGIGERVLRLRKAQGIERKDLAREAGMSYTGLSDLESGKAKSTTKLHRLAARLGVTPIYLETGKDCEPVEPKNNHVPKPLQLNPDTLAETARSLRERFRDGARVCALIENQPQKFIEAFGLYANSTSDKRTPEMERELAMKLADLTPQGANQDERRETVPVEGTPKPVVGTGGKRRR